MTAQSFSTGFLIAAILTSALEAWVVAGVCLGLSGLIVWGVK